MKTKAQELLDRLPGNWSEFTLRDFIKITEVEIEEAESDEEFGGLFVGLDNSLKIISRITDTPVADIEDMSIPEVNALGKKISFTLEPPKPLKNGKIKWRNLDSMTYSTFVSYVMLQKDIFYNLPQIIKALSVNEMTQEEILALGMDEVHTGFTTLRKHLKRFGNHSARSLGLKLAKQTIKETWNRLRPFKKKTNGKEKTS